MVGSKILVVDDNPTNMRLAAYLLRSRGYDVRTATDADEAMLEIGREKPDVILMDVQLPGMTGLELSQHLKASAETKDIVIIAVTANAMKGDEQHALASGCNAYVSKPIDTRSLPELIERLLENQNMESDVR
jgi:CheY-like chemotaxis protein